MTLREFGQTMWAGRWYFLLVLVAVVAGAYWYADRQVTEYSASTVVQLEQSTTETGVVTASDDPTVVTSSDVADAADAKLPGAGASASAVSATYDSETQTMTITAETSEPEQAVALVNAYAEAYAAHLPKIIDEQVALLDDQIAAVSEQVNDAREKLTRDKNDPVASALEQTGTESLEGLTTTRTAYQALVRPGYVSVSASEASPVGMDMTMVLLVAVLAGLVAGTGAAFLRRGLDLRVRSTTDAEALADAPVLARLAGARRAMRTAVSGGKVPVASRAATPFTESVRELRTAVQVAIGGGQRGMVVVSAADPRAPRAFVAANLAASFALSGRRTIVLAGDLRRPQIDAMLPPPDDWDGPPGQLRPSRIPNLEVCPTPEVALDPADFLASPSARDLVETVRRRADVVVIDAPPILAVADATILGSYADGVVLVAETGRTDRAVLAEAASRLATNSVRLLGVALAGPLGSKRSTYASTYGDAEQPAPPADPQAEGAVEAHETRSGRRARSSTGTGTGTGTSPRSQKPLDDAGGAGSSDDGGRHEGVIAARAS
ncbi:hypothetical protein [Isoptericola sp. NPDC055881]